MATIDNLIGKRVAVTGGTGLVGSHLIAELINQGCSDIVVLLRENSSQERVYDLLRAQDVAEEKFQTLRIERFNMSNHHLWVDNLQGVQIVYHCAAMVAIGGVDEQQIIEENNSLAMQVVEGCLKARVSLLVHVSSIATLARPYGSTEFIDESRRLDNFKGCSAYSISKFYAENQVLRGREMGLNSIIVHPAVILGPSNRNSSSSARIVVEAVERGFFYTDGVMGYVDVKDVARAMVALSMDSRVYGRGFLLCGANLSYRELITKIRSVASRCRPFVKVGRGLFNFVAALDALRSRLTGSQQIITKDIARNMTSVVNYDGSLITRSIDFEYTPIDDTINRITHDYCDSKKKVS